MYLELLHIFQALQIGVFAFVFSVLLTEPNYIFYDYYNALVKLKDCHPLGYLLAYPLGYCEKCLAGQIALWLYLVERFECYDWVNVPEHGFFIALSIFFTWLIDKRLNK